MDAEDIIIIILMFGAPILAALLDRKKKKGRGSSTRRINPVEWDFDGSFESRKKESEAEGTPAVKKEQKPVESPVEEPVLQEEEQKEGFKLDPRNLIIYNAIMNPKFDEHES